MSAVRCYTTRTRTCRTRLRPALFIFESTRPQRQTRDELLLSVLAAAQERSNRNFILAPLLYSLVTPSDPYWPLLAPLGAPTVVILSKVDLREKLVPFSATAYHSRTRDWPMFSLIVVYFYQVRTGPDKS